MKKIFLILAIALTTNLAYAQVGINSNETKKSTLYIKSLGNTDAFRVDDANGNPSLKVTNGGNVGIGNVTPSQPLHVKGGLKINEIKDKNPDTLTYNRVLMVNGSEDVNYVPLEKNFLLQPNNIRTIQYSTSSCELNAATPTNSVVDLGVLKLRYNYKPTAAEDQNKIEISVSESNYFAIYYEKSGAGIRQGKGNEKELRYYQAGNTAKDTWVPFKTNFNAVRRDMGTAIILLNNSKQVYRMTIIASPALPRVGNVPEVKSEITIFLERLKDDY